MALRWTRVQAGRYETLLNIRDVPVRLCAWRVGGRWATGFDWRADDYHETLRDAQEACQWMADHPEGYAWERLEK